MGSRAKSVVVVSLTKMNAKTQDAQGVTIVPFDGDTEGVVLLEEG
jgi:hypothetical protein